MSSGGGKAGQQGQFSYGPSQFDLQAILNALGSNEQAITNRYDQLGLSGPAGTATMMGQDLAQAGLQAQAAIGQEQTSSVQSPATNPALQSPSQVPGQALNALGSLAGNANSILNPGTGGTEQGIKAGLQ